VSWQPDLAGRLAPCLTLLTICRTSRFALSNLPQCSALHPTLPSAVPPSMHPCRSQLFAAALLSTAPLPLPIFLCETPPLHLHPTPPSVLAAAALCAMLNPLPHFYAEQTTPSVRDVAPHPLAPPLCAFVYPHAVAACPSAAPAAFVSFPGQARPGWLLSFIQHFDHTHKPPPEYFPCTNASVKCVHNAPPDWRQSSIAVSAWLAGQFCCSFRTQQLPPLSTA
jgi:hypothetical protein